MSEEIIAGSMVKSTISKLNESSTDSSNKMLTPTKRIQTLTKALLALTIVMTILMIIQVVMMVRS